MDQLYLQSVYIYSNYVDSHFKIDFKPENSYPFKHLLLTGKNGSGKSTVLNCIYKELLNLKSGLKSSSLYYKKLKDKVSKPEIQSFIDKMGYKHPKVELSFNIDDEALHDRTENLVIYIPSQRKFNTNKADSNLKVASVAMLSEQSKFINELIGKNQHIVQKKAEINIQASTIQNYQKQIITFEKQKQNILDSGTGHTVQNEQLSINAIKVEIQNNQENIETLKLDILALEANLNTSNPNISLSKFFQQYLVEKRREQAYAIADENEKIAEEHTSWFRKFDKLIQYLFETPDIKLKHELKTSSFYFEMNGGRRFDFDQLADGYGSVIFILAEIILQLEAYKETNGLNEDPIGIVLIDELEAHLHISLQEKILPSLVEFFPKLQFIICTHSPQILSSIDNANIYDLSSHELVTEDLGGISYDVISKEHFGLGSEYSLRATKLLDTAKSLLKKKELSNEQQSHLKEIYEALNNLSPELGYEIYLHLNRPKSIPEV